MVGRNHEGKVLFAASKRVRATWPVEIVEGKALLMALRLTLKFGHKNVILEYDSQVIISRLSKAMVYFVGLDSVLEDIILLSSELNHLSWSHVKRNGNSVSHHLARLVLFDVEQTWANHYHAEVTLYVFMDSLSMD